MTLLLQLPKTFKPKVDLDKSIVNPNDCQIDADNDLRAVQAWLNRYDKKTTYRAYKKEVERFILWCICERGLYLHELKVNDFEAYFKFLQNPSVRWSDKIEKPLCKSSLILSIRIIGSFMSYLTNANYLKANPMKLLKTSQLLKQQVEERKYQVWSRMLEEDEWLAIQNTLANLPEETERPIDYKLKVQFLFALLYLLGLRIHEVANHTWGAFRKLNGQWWFMALGKGDRLGHIPVNDQLLSMVKIYRLHLGKMPLPEPNECEYLIVSSRTTQPLKTRQLFRMVKDVGRLASEQFKNNPSKYQKLLNFSPHWLRHLSASHQDKAGISGTMIQANHRHGSFSTTQIYLHSEDARRFEEMQKLRMAVEPRMITKPQPDITTVLTIALTGGPLSDQYGLERFISLVERYVFQKLEFKRLSEVSYLMQRYQKIKIFREPLYIMYDIKKELSEDEMANMRVSIVREAKVRLFECGLSIERK